MVLELQRLSYEIIIEGNNRRKMSLTNFISKHGSIYRFMSRGWLDRLHTETLGYFHTRTYPKPPRSFL